VSYHPTTATFVLADESDRHAMIGRLRALQIRTGRPWRLIIEPDTPKRTVKQNTRMWSVFRYIAANAWVNGKQFSAEAWHHHYAGEFIGWEESPDGSKVPVGTSTLNTREHNGFVDRVIADAATKHGIDWTQWDEKEA
jgi:hypothetical protein